MDSGKTSIKRKQILNAAATIFSQKGFHQARMDEIALMANVAKGTLYYNFSSKSLLFAATVTEGMEGIVRQIRTELVSDLPFPEHFQLLVTSIVRLYLQHSDLAHIIFNEISSGIDDAVLVEIERVRSRFIEFIAEMIEKGQKKGYIKPIDLKLSAVALAGIIDSVCSHLLQHPDEATEEQAVATLHDMLSTGLLSGGQ
ncbi:TetR/AcrR family transcriptional regulator [Desulfoluna spongiiphila]|uniref:Transcriptional regulator, TetR family n=1 Tax=Desulfoluna spongiiphila TaxID=419481 RepID=A0A1G5H324_9BACT|nr:TetR/AcrR family transcriptional regulator [Desulfoluna spongiiphila]SCY58166.1 transcriptional regulator, TetR family [Desulfoluna spongiiphila]VVS94757.1 dna-binding hth domain tetr-type [Desulfoluna spongiiphila]